jgi:hypothetical protein
MLYFLLCENADKDIITTLVKEVDDALQGTDPIYGTHKKQKYAEAWYVTLVSNSQRPHDSLHPQDDSPH